MRIKPRDLVVSDELKHQFERMAFFTPRPKGSILFRRGDKVAGVFLICSGKVSLRMDGNSTLFPDRILGPGSVVGLPATVSGSPYSLTAEVVEDADVGFVPRESVIGCLRTHPQLCFQVMDVLSGEISDIRSAIKGEVDSKDLPAASR